MSDIPKRPMSAYMLWLNSAREKIKAENPGLKVTEIAKKGGEIWRSMKDKSVWEEKAAQVKEQYTNDLQSCNLLLREEEAQAREQYTKDLKSYNFVQSQLNKTKPQLGPDLDHESRLLEFAGANRSTGDGDHQKDDTKNNVIDLGDIFTSGSGEVNIDKPLEPVNLRQSDDVDLLGEQESKTEVDSLGEQQLKQSLPENFDGFNRKKVKISDNPKRPMSAYLLWLNSAREKIKAENPGMKVTEIAKKGGEIWRSMKDKSVWEEKAAQVKEQYTNDLVSYNLMLREEEAQAREQCTKDLKSYNFLQSQLNKTKPQPGPDLDHESRLLELAGANSTGDGDHQKDDTKNNVIDLSDIFTSGSGEVNIDKPLKPVNLRQSDDVDLLGEQKIKTEVDSLGEQQLKQSLPENFDDFNRKKVKISDNPKRPMSAYLLWLNSAREKIKAENPGMKVTEIAKKGGEIWRSMKDKSVWEEKAAQVKEQYTNDLVSYNLMLREEEAQAREQCTKDLKSYNFVQSQLNKTKPQPGPDLDHESRLLELAGANRSTGDGDHQKDDTKNNVINLGDIFTSGSGDINMDKPLKPVNLRQSDDVDLLGEQESKTEVDSLGEQQLKQSLPENFDGFNRKKVKMSDKPKRPMSAYMLWLYSAIGKIKAENPGLKITEIAKKGGQIWRSMKDKSVWEEKAAQVKELHTNDLESYNLMLREVKAQAREQYTKDLKSCNFVQSQLNKTKPQPDHEYCLLEFAGANRSTGDEDHQKDDTKNNVIDLGDIFTSGSGESNIDKPLKPVNLRQSDDVDLLGEQKSKTEVNSLGEQQLKQSLPENSKNVDDFNRKKVEMSVRPRRPLSSYMLWLNSAREKLKAENPGMKHTEILKKGGEMWRSLKDKSLWEEKAAQAREQYRKELDSYNSLWEEKTAQAREQSRKLWEEKAAQAREQCRKLWEEKAAQAREQSRKDLESYNLKLREEARAREQSKNLKSYNFVQSQLNKTKPQPGPNLDHESRLLELAGANRSTGEGDHQKENNVINELGDIFTSGSGECSIAEPLKPVNLGHSAKRMRMDSPDDFDSQKLHDPALRARVQKNITPEQLEKRETGCSERHTRAQPKENYDSVMLRDIKTEPKESTFTSCSDCATIPQNEPDNRIDYFSNLIKEELQYVQPCMRTRMFARILNFLHTYKKFHSNDLDPTDSEKND